jgi:hypothetical protein
LVYNPFSERKNNRKKEEESQLTEIAAIVLI